MIINSNRKGLHGTELEGGSELKTAQRRSAAGRDGCSS